MAMQARPIKFEEEPSALSPHLAAQPLLRWFCCSLHACPLACQEIFPVSASLLLYVALCDWFDDLWPDCPSGHSRVHLVVYLVFAVTEFLLLISASDLQTILLCLLNVWKERATSCCQFHPVPFFNQNAPVPQRLCFLLNLLLLPRSPPSLPCVQCSAFHFVLGRRWAQLDSETQEIWHHLFPAMF